VILVGAAVLCTLVPGVLEAQADSPLPTLSDLGIGYMSAGGAVQLSFSGSLDLEGYAPGSQPPWLIPDTEPFATGRLRLFSDLFLGDSWFVTAELRVDGGEAPTRGRVDARLEQFFLRWTPSTPLFGIQVGKFVSPFGSYPSRHHTPADPLIRPPIMYEFRTMVSAEEVPGNSAQFLQWRDELAEEFRPIGAPPVWGAPYQWGGMAFGAVGPLDYRVAVVNSAPSSEPWEWALEPHFLDRPSFVAGAGWRFAPWLRAELWHNRGPYLQEEVRGSFPGDAGPWDYDQILWGGEVVFQRGHTTVRGEVLHDTWEVPNVEQDVLDVSYSVEWHRKFGPDWFAAARFGGIEFNRIRFSGTRYDGTFAEGEGSWDFPVRRLQVGGGWRALMNAGIRAEYAWNWSLGPLDPMGDLLSIQLWWHF
jgi:hypothetical protein